MISYLSRSAGAVGAQRIKQPLFQITLNVVYSKTQASSTPNAVIITLTNDDDTSIFSDSWNLVNKCLLSQTATPFSNEWTQTQDDVVDEHGGFCPADFLIWPSLLEPYYNSETGLRARDCKFYVRFIRFQSNAVPDTASFGFGQDQLEDTINFENLVSESAAWSSLVDNAAIISEIKRALGKPGTGSLVGFAISDRVLACYWYTQNAWKPGRRKEGGKDSDYSGVMITRAVSEPPTCVSDSKEMNVNAFISQVTAPDALLDDYDVARQGPCPNRCILYTFAAPNVTSSKGDLYWTMAFKNNVPPDYATRGASSGYAYKGRTEKYWIRKLGKDDEMKGLWHTVQHGSVDGYDQSAVKKLCSTSVKNLDVTQDVDSSRALAAGATLLALAPGAAYMRSYYSTTSGELAWLHVVASAGSTDYTPARTALTFCTSTTSLWRIGYQVLFGIDGTSSDATSIISDADTKAEGAEDEQTDVADLTPVEVETAQGLTATLANMLKFGAYGVYFSSGTYKTFNDCNAYYGNMSVDVYRGSWDATRCTYDTGCQGLMAKVTDFDSIVSGQDYYNTHLNPGAPKTHWIHKYMISTNGARRDKKDKPFLVRYLPLNTDSSKADYHRTVYGKIVIFTADKRGAITYSMAHGNHSQHYQWLINSRF